MSWNQASVCLWRGFGNLVPVRLHQVLFSVHWSCIFLYFYYYLGSKWLLVQLKSNPFFSIHFSQPTFTIRVKLMPLHRRIPHVFSWYQQKLRSEEPWKRYGASITGRTRYPTALLEQLKWTQGIHRKKCTAGKSSVTLMNVVLWVLGNILWWDTVRALRPTRLWVRRNVMTWGCGSRCSEATGGGLSGHKSRYRNGGGGNN